MIKCSICPRECSKNKKNYCSKNNMIRIAKTDLFYYEEPCISNKYGSGTIFFSGCNLKCVFCQNYEISFNNTGLDVSIERLSQIMIELQGKGAKNINLVSPMHYIVEIAKSIILAKGNGLIIPIIYNTNAYEKVTSLKILDGLIDVYLPDMKYCSEEYAIKYSNASDYFIIASQAIEEMYRQVGHIQFDSDGYIKRGLIVRHLIMPGMINDSKKILKYLYKTYGNNIYLSIMNQWTPTKNLKKYAEINRNLSNKEYDEVVNYAIKLGIEKAYVQEEDSNSLVYVPDFDGSGV